MLLLWVPFPKGVDVIWVLDLLGEDGDKTARIVVVLDSVLAYIVSLSFFIFISGRNQVFTLLKKRGKSIPLHYFVCLRNWFLATIVPLIWHIVITEALNLWLVQLKLPKSHILCSECLAPEWPIVVRVLLRLIVEEGAVNWMVKPILFVGVDCLLSAMLAFINFGLMLFPLKHLHCSNKSVGIFSTDSEMFVWDRFLIVCWPNSMDKSVVHLILRLVRVDLFDLRTSLVENFRERHKLSLIHP